MSIVSAANATDSLCKPPTAGRHPSANPAPRYAPHVQAARWGNEDDILHPRRG